MCERQFYALLIEKECWSYTPLVQAYDLVRESKLYCRVKAMGVYVFEELY